MAADSLVLGHVQSAELYPLNRAVPSTTGITVAVVTPDDPESSPGVHCEATYAPLHTHTHTHTHTHC